MNSPIRISFVIMPFHDIWQPNLATSILKKSLTNAGFQCDIYYANIEFSKRVGAKIYDEIIDEKIPFGADLLFSDYYNNTCLSNTSDYFYPSLIGAKDYIDEFIEDTAKKIIEGKYNIIGFNVNFHTIPCLALSKRIKELSPETKIIFGGSNCDNDMGLAMHESFPCVDFVCRGEGENLIVEIAESLSGGKPLKDIKGLIWRKDGQSVSNGNKTDTIIDLDTIPTPDFDDWALQMKSHGLEKNKDEFILPYESSRGCWHGAKHTCIFCGLCGEYQTYRIKSSEKVIDELVYFSNKYTVNRFFAMDLVFPYQYFDTFLPELKKRNSDFRFGYEIRATVTHQQLKALYEANITYVLSGIESLNTNNLGLLRKGTQAYQNIRLLKWGFGYGINVLWFQLYGCPGEKTEDFNAIIQLIPYISHLLPPKSVELIGMHRFSPLYEERDKLTLQNVRPDKIYDSIYNLPKEQLEKLAYYFEYDKGPFEYIDSLNQTVNEWHNLVGKSIFFFIRYDNKLFFYDSRPIAKELNPILSGLEKDIYLACDAGIHLKNLVEQFNIEENEIICILERLCSRNLIILIDDRYLNLAVEFYNPIFEISYIEPALYLYAEIYKTWMLAMFNAKKTHK